ncbi:hypothetical protein LEN26_004995 [Aphanomyces euteiches]|nr:hypothetical protein AeMF1_003957 [Aphanomyces euteiches]KAH9145086.1 hypothetical protein LEN26_004995 [Aphanomyces euteiches]
MRCAVQVALFFVATTSGSARAAQSSDLDAKVQAIVNAMTTDQLLGQMNQIDIGAFVIDNAAGAKVVNETQVQEYVSLGVGSYLNTPGLAPLNNKYNWNTTEYRTAITKIQEMHMKNNGIPILYGLDSVHGANYVNKAVIFPHAINTGATFNTTLTHQAGLYTGRDTKAAGIPWVFGPMMEPVRHKHWSRIYESFNEDPAAVASLAAAYIEGMQSQKVAACIKHLIAYSDPIDGNDRSNVNESTYELLNYFVPPFKAAVDVGVLSVMGSYISLNGVPVSANSVTSRDLLRHDLNFTGVLVSDYGEIYLLRRDHKVVSTDLDAVDLSMNKTSYDLSMTPWDTSFITWGKQLVAANRLSVARLKESVARIIKLKLQLDLWNNPVPGSDVAPLIGDQASRDAALNIAQESIALLKNTDNILPLAPSSSSIFLTGPSMDDVGYLCGGWSLYWQGTSGKSMFANGVSIRDGIERLVHDGDASKAFAFLQGVQMESGNLTSDLDDAAALARNATYTIVALGERTYAEDGGNKDLMPLPSGFTDYVQALAATGTKIILVLTQGRPRLLGNLTTLASAILYAGLPCELGGQAIANVLFGRVNPSGKLPLTYPKTDTFDNLATPYYKRNGTHCLATGALCPAEFEFGAGLSYTTFQYSNAALSKSSMTYKQGENHTLVVSVVVTNTGKVAGQETILLFVTPPPRANAESKLLKKFTKVWLSPGEAKTVTFGVAPDDWGYYSNEIGQGLAKSAPTGTYVWFFQGSGDKLSFEWTMPGTSAVLPRSESSKAQSDGNAVVLSVVAVVAVAWIHVWC